MRSGFIDCAGARRENRRPLEYQRGQPAGSVWDRTSAPAAPKPAGATIFWNFEYLFFYTGLVHRFETALSSVIGRQLKNLGGLESDFRLKIITQLETCPSKST